MVAAKRVTTTWTNNRRPYKQPRYNYRSAPRYNTQRVYTATNRSMAPAATRGYRTNAVEKKSFDQGLLSFAFSASGDFTNLIFPASGGDINQRIGRKVTVKSIYIKGRVTLEMASTLASSGTVPATHARMIIVVDYQPNGANPTTADLLANLSPASQLNLGNRERFKIICEKNYFFDPMVYPISGAGTWNRTGSIVKKYCKTNIDMVFSGATGSIADLKTGAIYMFWISNNASPQACVFIGTTRVRYSDS